MRNQNRLLNILMNGTLVGQLEKTKNTGFIFKYDQDWLDTLGARPISLSLPLMNQQYIQRRYFLDAAKAVNYSPIRAEQILDEMLEQTDEVIQKVSCKLPKKFPRKISEPIFEGMVLLKRRLLK